MSGWEGKRGEGTTRGRPDGRTAAQDVALLHHLALFIKAKQYDSSKSLSTLKKKKKKKSSGATNSSAPKYE